MRLLILVALLAAFLGTTIAQKKVVCYFGSWATYRQGNGQFNVDNIDPNLCTHLIYAFVSLAEDGSVKLNDPWNDLPNDGGKDSIGKFNKLKSLNPNLKTLVAIGGWNAGTTIFSKVVNDPYLRGKFVQNAVNFVRQYGFNGFDIDWEYPEPKDKAAFTSLIKELRTEFDKYRFLLSAAVTANKNVIETSYDAAAMGMYLDFINVMTYDFAGSWDPYTGFNAPLYPPTNPTGNAVFFNDQYSIQFWINKGAPRNKLILGVPSYARTWTLQSTVNTNIGAPASGAGNQGPYTQEAGSLGYYEICESLKMGGWTTKWDDIQKVPYAFKGNQWVSYDNTESIKLKANYALQQSLGGIMTWSIDTDDFRGTCTGTKYPILRAMNDGLNGNSPPGNGETVVTPGTTKPPSTPPSTSPSTPPSTSPSTPPSSPTEICKTAGYTRDRYDCAKFYFCQPYNGNFIMYPFSCPSGTYFDAKLLVCNYKNLVVC